MEQKTARAVAVAILGASDKEERYAYRALKLLQENGYKVLPVHPRIKKIDGLPVFPRLADIPKDSPVDTLTLYVNGATVLESISDILNLRPRRVIMNPGTENASATRQLADQGIEVLEACTLVMLKTGQF
jgi:predicted CoA-binding protein